MSILDTACHAETTDEPLTFRSPWEVTGCAPRLATTQGRVVLNMTGPESREAPAVASKRARKISLADKQKAATARRAKVLKHVQAEGVATAQTVADAFGVSRDTGYGDLKYLTDIGKLSMREIQRMKLYFVPVKKGVEGRVEA